MAKILIAEDNPDNLDILCELLADEGYEVVTASNTADVIARAHKDHPDLILMDLQMPDSIRGKLNDAAGLEATRVLRQQAGTQNIPVIALTGYDSAEARVAIDSAGCDAIGNKPYDFAVLLATVADLIRRI